MKDERAKDEDGRLEAAASILAQAFACDPALSWVFPDDRSRPQRLSWLFHRDLRAITRFGGSIDLDDEVHPRGVAVWMSGASPFVPLSAELASGFWAAPFVLGPVSVSRLIKLSDYHARWRKKAVPGPHFFLALLGVVPEAQGKGVARLLLDRGLASADQAGWPAALETQTEKNVTLYQHFGFERISDALIVANGPRCWAMVRPTRKPETAADASRADNGYPTSR